jgi:hypothetical protein
MRTMTLLLTAPCAAARSLASIIDGGVNLVVALVTPTGERSAKATPGRQLIACCVPAKVLLLREYCLMMRSDAATVVALARSKRSLSWMWVREKSRIFVLHVEDEGDAPDGRSKSRFTGCLIKMYFSTSATRFMVSLILTQQNGLALKEPQTLFSRNGDRVSIKNRRKRLIGNAERKKSTAQKNSKDKESRLRDKGVSTTAFVSHAAHHLGSQIK